MAKRARTESADSSLVLSEVRSSPVGQSPGTLERLIAEHQLAKLQRKYEFQIAEVKSKCSREIMHSSMEIEQYKLQIKEQIQRIEKLEGDRKFLYQKVKDAKAHLQKLEAENTELKVAFTD